MHLTWNDCMSGELEELLRIANEITIFEGSPVVVAKCSFWGEFELDSPLADEVRKVTKDTWKFLQRWKDLQPHRTKSSGILTRVPL